MICSQSLPKRWQHDYNKEKRKWKYKQNRWATIIVCKYILWFINFCLYWCDEFSSKNDDAMMTVFLDQTTLEINGNEWDKKGVWRCQYSNNVQQWNEIRWKRISTSRHSREAIVNMKSCAFVCLFVIVCLSLYLQCIQNNTKRRTNMSREILQPM